MCESARVGGSLHRGIRSISSAANSQTSASPNDFRGGFAEKAGGDLAAAVTLGSERLRGRIAIAARWTASGGSR